MLLYCYYYSALKRLYIFFHLLFLTEIAKLNAQLLFFYYLKKYQYILYTNRLIKYYLLIK